MYDATTIASQEEDALSLGVQDQDLLGERPPVGEAVGAPTQPIEEHQEFWTGQTASYETSRKYGPEVYSAIAGAGKVFWCKEITKEEELNSLLERSKIPSNCTFLNVLKVNKEAWSETRPDVRTRDCNVQKSMESLGQGAACVIQAADHLHNLKSELVSANPEITQKFAPVFGCIKDALMLFGRMKLQMNNQRRESFKDSLPDRLKSIVSKPEEEFQEFLFGDDLPKRLAEIRGDISIRDEFKRDKLVRSNKAGKENKGEHPASSGNYKPSLKARGGKRGGYKSTRGRGGSNTRKQSGHTSTKSRRDNSRDRDRRDHRDRR